MMEKQEEYIHWAPRIQPILIKRLYESDSLGFEDDDLCNDVGYRLFMRCHTILMVSKDEVACPRCGAEFVIDTTDIEAITICPTRDCGWQTSMLEYRQSWSKRRIWGANALPAFEEYHQRFSPALAYRKKMILIDHLIHSFHWSLEQSQPARSAANNLIEGSHDQVVAFLDQLTGIDRERKEAWRATMQQMMHRRKGGRA